MKLLILILSIFILTPSVSEAQTSKRKAKKTKTTISKKQVPQSYGLLADTIPGKTATRRIVRIDLDSLQTDTTEFRRVVFKTDSTTTFVEYTIDLTAAPPFRDSLNAQEFFGNMKFNIKVLKTAKYTAFKTSELAKIQREIDKLDKEKAIRVKSREELKKQ